MRDEVNRPDKELVKRLEKLAPASATVWSALIRLGLRSSFLMEGIRPIAPGSVVVGPAVTVEYKNYDDVGLAFTPDDFRDSAVFKACDALKKGDVMVLGALGNPSGIIGDCMAFGFKVKGAKGVVIDGGVRDSPIIVHRYKFPVFARNVTPTASSYQVWPTNFNVPIKCGGVLVKPGDVIVGDDDGVVVVPQRLLKDVVEFAEKEVKIEEIGKRKMLEEIPKGASLGEFYPPKEEWLEE